LWLSPGSDGVNSTGFLLSPGGDGVNPTGFASSPPGFPVFPPDFTPSPTGYTLLQTFRGLPNTLGNTQTKFFSFLMY
jgi:hypothetical protein